VVPFRRHLSSDMLGLGLSITKGSPSGLESAFSYVGGRADVLFSGVYVKEGIPGLIALTMLGGLK